MLPMETNNSFQRTYTVRLPAIEVGQNLEVLVITS